MLRFSFIPYRTLFVVGSPRRSGTLSCDPVNRAFPAGTLQNFFYYIARGRSILSCRFKREIAPPFYALTDRSRFATTEGECVVPTCSREGFKRGSTTPALSLFYPCKTLPEAGGRPASAQAGAVSFGSWLPHSLFYSSIYLNLLNLSDQNFKAAGGRPASARAGAVSRSRAEFTQRTYYQSIYLPNPFFIGRGRPAPVHTGAAPFIHSQRGCGSARFFIIIKLGKMFFLAVMPASSFFNASRGNHIHISPEYGGRVLEDARVAVFIFDIDGEHVTLARPIPPGDPQQ